ncbi:MAG: 4-hydroxythreonine-4-phosphate dehydrogenase PdxA [Rhodospirillales bacterium RIFCSPLOWO2_12_FULL_58_28]|nr:MAG: 4-hydroxythreonine-4-phosphate dehydrogenase PdxA [Rhodospirillales bacterium RIFCSPLOWO2_02_FULL_58_16]OHC77187.1 MAG: 4-hydroxythreonine-4-phosphate dehydrogenase PdxA [Rhodospirillales bacterium RIFCSPLOWO2_12_FULL_58_28]
MTPSYGGGGGKPLALTMGEPAGVGGEITLKAWLRRREGVPPFFVVDDVKRLEELAGKLGLEVTVAAIGAPEEATAVFLSKLPVWPLSMAVKARPGELNPDNAAAVRSSIEIAVAFVRSGAASAVVTNPIHKQCMYEAGFNFPGHTEFLADLAGISTPPVMMLLCPELRVAPVTIHVSLNEAVRSLTAEAIVTMAVIVEAALRRDFSIAEPRLAVAGLNPHAGEGGAMGDEEIKIIGPAVVELQRLGVKAFGPEPPDTLFDARARKTYDAVICMYHDQALIPIKTIAFDHAVNVTLGLPFVRTSPDHGTALNIAGFGKADETSLIAALKLAADMAHHRAVND